MPLSRRSLCTASLLIAGLAAILSTSCSHRREPADAEAPPTAVIEELEIRAGDFSFAARRTTPAGLTRVRLRSEGPSFHHIQLVRLDPGHSADEYVARLAAGDFAPTWAHVVGGPEPAGRRSESSATMLLTEGEYAIVCLISEGHGAPHVLKGMHLPLTVTAPRGVAHDVAMVLREYDFVLSAPLRAGPQTIRVENRGAQAHHVTVVRLGPGRRAQDALEWFREMRGDAPDQPVGGTTGLEPGAVNYITAEFTPGEYALICFIPDPSDGKSHAHHGMLRTVRVE